MKRASGIGVYGKPIDPYHSTSTLYFLEIYEGWLRVAMYNVN